jgi:hypothetical protein
MVTVGVCVGVVIVALAVRSGMSGGPSGGSKPSVSGNVYFSADDGKTVHPFSPYMVPPFEKDGKTWVRAYVFVCPGKGQQVAFLEKYSPRAVEQLGKLSANPMEMKDTMDQLSVRGSLIKKPGDKEWMVRNTGDVKSDGVTEVRCGDGSLAKEVLP